MTPVITLQIALRALERNKMRTALTMLGIVIGVGAVITMVALGRGAQSAIAEQIRSAGRMSSASWPAISRSAESIWARGHHPN
jgi:putative ABC transport system permease protein